MYKTINILITICLVSIFGCGTRQKSDVLGSSGTITTVDAADTNVAESMASMAKQSTASGTAANGAERAAALASSLQRASALVGANMTGLGEADNTDGHYSPTFSGETGETGTVKMWFLTGQGADHTDTSKVFYISLDMVDLTGGGLYGWPSQSITAIKQLLTQQIMQQVAQGQATYYIPCMWRILSTNAPMSTGWLTISASNLSTLSTAMNTFFNDWSNYGPKGMFMIIDVTDAGGATMHMEMSSAFQNGPPTNTAPQHVTGSGYRTETDGQKVTIKNMDMYIGDNGPISGTMETTCNLGHKALMTWNADGTADGTLYDTDGVTLMGTIHINADKTAYWTDTLGVKHDLN